MIIEIVMIIETVLQGSFHLTKGWEQLLHLCDKRQFGKGGRRVTFFNLRVNMDVGVVASDKKKWTWIPPTVPVVVGN